MPSVETFLGLIKFVISNTVMWIMLLNVLQYPFHTNFFEWFFHYKTFLFLTQQHKLTQFVAIVYSSLFHLSSNTPTQNGNKPIWSSTLAGIILLGSNVIVKFAFISRQTITSDVWLLSFDISPVIPIQISSLVLRHHLRQQEIHLEKIIVCFF